MGDIDALGVWSGFADPQTVLLEAAPGCAAAIEAARPFIGSEQDEGG
ncbi:hypothetical protein [Pararhizobium haloflavum]|nr:hypothetical protein [Pararhizobium haloflavum]